MKISAACILVLALTLATGVLRADDTSFRCGNDLIDRGYTMYQVKKSCGAPDSEQVTGSRELSKIHTPSNTKSETTMNITEWIYERDSGIYVLTFEGDKLIRKEYRNTD